MTQKTNPIWGFFFCLSTTEARVDFSRLEYERDKQKPLQKETNKPRLLNFHYAKRNNILNVKPETLHLGELT